jgi:branched-chain amino acid transport system ATP-binding protein
MSLLQLRDVAVSYGPIEAVRGVDLDIEEGEIACLLGPNGAGKSSLLQSLVGLVPMSRGVVRLDGRDVRGVGTRSVVRAGMTLTPEGRRIFGRLTVRENLRIGAGRSMSIYEERLPEVLELFPVLGERQDQHAGTLSGGEQQQLAIGRSLMSRPRLLLLDEPSLGLAPILVRTMMNLVARLPRLGTTVVLVEQNVEQALRIADRAFVMVKGVVEEPPTSSTTLDRAEIQRAFLRPRGE